MTAATTGLLSPAQAQARLPLLRAIAAELEQRIEELSGLTRQDDAAARELARHLRRCVRGCLQELEALGVELESLRPVSLKMTTLDESGDELSMRWKSGQATLRKT